MPRIFDNIDQSLLPALEQTLFAACWMGTLRAKHWRSGIAKKTRNAAGSGNGRMKACPPAYGGALDPPRASQDTTW
ncbi:MAG TPA: hypothetical protein VM223_09360 [Planctomycetota bacterium]|nr:hypothetical protein [Planctomycetota bacterium]